LTKDISEASLGGTALKPELMRLDGGGRFSGNQKQNHTLIKLQQIAFNFKPETRKSARSKVSYLTDSGRDSGQNKKTPPGAFTGMWITFVIIQIEGLKKGRRYF